MTAPRSVSPDMAKALRVAAIVAAVRLRPTEPIFRSTRGGEGEARQRQEVQWLLHTACGMSLNRVAKVMGRDRSTISYANQQVEDELTEPGYAHRMERLAALCKELVAIGELEDDATAKALARGRV